MKFQEILDKCIQTGLKPRIADEKISEKHKVPVDVVLKCIRQGTLVELEHTSNRKIAETIASHHLYERIDYYKKLNGM